MKRLVLWLAFFPLFTTLLTAQETKQMKEDYREPETEVIFPKKMAEMHLQDVTDYRPHNTGLGVGIRYRHTEEKNIYATIYVYNGGLETIADGIKSKSVVAVFNQAERELQSVDYTFLRLRNKGERKSPDRAYLSVRYTFRNNGEKFDTYLLVVGCKNNFIKIRYTFPSEKQQLGEKVLDNLLAGLDNVLK